MIIKNHSALPDALAEHAVKECIGAYEVLYAERGKIQPGAERHYGTFHGIIENGKAIHS